MIDHAYIEEADLVSRYVLHRLSPEEEQAFEAHFVDCPECLDRLDQTRQLRAGLATVATDAALTTHPPAMRRALALAAGVVLCVGAAVAIAQIVGLRGELASLRQDQAQTAARNGDLARRADDLQRQLDRRPPQTMPSAPAGAETAAPVGSGVPVVALSMVRGAASAETSPPVQVSVPSASPLVVLLLDLGNATSSAYRVTLSTVKGETVWSNEHLVPTTPAELAVAVPSALLPSGDYAVQVDSERRDGRVVPVGHFAFRVRVKP